MTNHVESDHVWSFRQVLQLTANNGKYVQKPLKQGVGLVPLPPPKKSEPYGIKPPEWGNYELSIPYRNDETLDKTVHDLLTEISQEAEMRNCLIQVDAWEEALNGGARDLAAVGEP